jgi:hypothetical protein
MGVLRDPRATPRSRHQPRQGADRTHCVIRASAPPLFLRSSPAQRSAPPNKAGPVRAFEDLAQNGMRRETVPAPLAARAAPSCASRKTSSAQSAGEPFPAVWHLRDTGGNRGWKGASQVCTGLRLLSMFVYTPLDSLDSTRAPFDSARGGFLCCLTRTWALQ